VGIRSEPFLLVIKTESRPGEESRKRSMDQNTGPCLGSGCCVALSPARSLQRGPDETSLIQIKYSE
jgi:hypothetical protein